MDKIAVIDYLIPLFFISFFAGIIFLPDIFMRKKAGKLFLPLKENGFQPIDTSQLSIIERVEFKDPSTSQFPFYGKKNRAKILSALSKKISPSSTRYILFTKLRLTKKTFYEIKLIDICKTCISCKISVGERMHPSLESMLAPLIKKQYQIWGLKEIKEGLHRDFIDKFIVMAEDANLRLPENLQKYLINTCVRQSQTDRPTLDHLFFSREGWSLGSHVINRSKLEQLLEMSDNINKHLTRQST